MRLNIGCGNVRIEGFLGVDFRPGPAVDYVVDLTVRPWPFPSDSAEEVRAWHVLEHLPGYSFHYAMDEIHRVLRPGGVLYVKVPYKERGPYDAFHFRVFDRTTFGRWLPDGDGVGTCLQERRSTFRRERQEVWYDLGPFPGYHLKRHAPLVLRFLATHFGSTDERSTEYPMPVGLPVRRELREWLVKL